MPRNSAVVATVVATTTADGRRLRMRHESERDGDRPADRRPAARAGGPRTRSTQSIRVAVTGLAATYPFGGVFWDYMQYVLGLHRLGHDVLYIEDNGRWCYDPG